MTQLLEGMTRIVLIGVGATMVMDVWLMLLKRLKVPTLNFALLGRWVGYALRGKWTHNGIAKTPPINGEVLLGWAAHYAIGIAFAALLIGVYGLAWARSPSLLPGVLIGVGTVIAPLFIMQPAMGSGIASSKTPTPLLNCMKSLVNHTVFGVGLYLAAFATAAFISN